MKFLVWKLRVCLYCLWYLRHWPWNDLSDHEWAESFFFGDDPWQSFLDGWCCDNDRRQ